MKCDCLIDFGVIVRLSLDVRCFFSERRRFSGASFPQRNLARLWKRVATALGVGYSVGRPAPALGGSRTESSCASGG